MPYTPAGITVDPNGQTVVVNLTTPSGSAAVAYTTQHGSTLHSFPVTITGRTGFFVADSAIYTLSATVGGVENANGAGGTRSVDLSGRGVLGVQIPLADPNDAANYLTQTAAKGTYASLATDIPGLLGLEEFFQTTTIEPHGGTINTTRSYALFVAQQPCMVTSLSLVQWDGPATIALDPTNYWTITLDRYRAAVSANIAAKGTANNSALNEVWTKRVPWTFDLSTFSPTNMILAKDDIVGVSFNMTGTPGAPVKVSATYKVEML